jgi:hypothetical protein
VSFPSLIAAVHAIGWLAVLLPSWYRPQHDRLLVEIPASGSDGVLEVRWTD